MGEDCVCRHTRMCGHPHTYSSPQTSEWMCTHICIAQAYIHMKIRKKIARNLWLCNISKKARKFSTDASIKAWNIKRWWPTDQRFVSIGRFLVQTSCLLPYTYIPKKKRERKPCKIVQILKVEVPYNLDFEFEKRK